MGEKPEEINETNAQGEYALAVERSLLTFVASSFFCVGINHFMGAAASEEYFAGYLVEQSLSVDNLLVFVLLFDYFKIPREYQNRILKWGILGAIVMRGIMITLGVELIQSFHAILLVFAGILVYSSATVLWGLVSNDEDEEDEDLSQNWIVNFSQSLLPTTHRFDEDQFFTFEKGMKVATPMFLCMVAVELSDVVFAVDSIPAVFGITENPFIIFSSNIFAILGLRSLYTVLSKAASDFKYLEPAVAIVLGFIGTKMFAEFFGIYVPTILSLGIVITMISSGCLLSIYEKNREEQA